MEYASSISLIIVRGCLPLFAYFFCLVLSLGSVCSVFLSSWYDLHLLELPRRCLVGDTPHFKRYDQ